MGPNIEDINNIAKKLSKDIAIQALGEVKDFLSIHITINRENKEIYLSQTKYIYNKIKEYNKDNIGFSEIPIKNAEKLVKFTKTVLKEDIL